jgi:hypothetical protein
MYDVFLWYRKNIQSIILNLIRVKMLIGKFSKFTSHYTCESSDLNDAVVALFIKRGKRLFQTKKNIEVWASRNLHREATFIRVMERQVLSDDQMCRIFFI